MWRWQNQEVHGLEVTAKKRADELEVGRTEISSRKSRLDASEMKLGPVDVEEIYQFEEVYVYSLCVYIYPKYVYIKGVYTSTLYVYI